MHTSTLTNMRTHIFFLLGQSTQSATVVDWLEWEAVYLLMKHLARPRVRQLNNMHNILFVVVDAMAVPY